MENLLQNHSVKNSPFSITYCFEPSLLSPLGKSHHLLYSTVTNTLFVTVITSISLAYTSVIKKMDK